MKYLLWIFSVLLIFQISSVQAQQQTNSNKNNKNKVDKTGKQTSNVKETRQKPSLHDMWSFISQDPISTERHKPKVDTRRKSNKLCKLCQFMYNEADGEFVETGDTRRFCVHLLQAKNCMTELREERIQCNFILSMILKGAVKVQLDRNKCEDHNVTADDLVNVLRSGPPEPDVGLNCRYRPPPKNNASLGNNNLSVDNRMMHCGMFGDPHIKTFFAVHQTCVIAGDWSLLDNEYMSVNVTNEIVQNTRITSATATTKVFIVFKERDLVCSRHEEYVATSTYLPEKFKGGSNATGPTTCQTRIHKQSNDSVVITSCRANTTIIIRRVGKYLTFNVNMPNDIVNNSVGLCHSGCPVREIVDYKTFFENSLQSTEEESMTTNFPLSYDEAMSLCSHSNLTDFYYDSCVFDLMTTGDRQFSKAAKLAMFDAVYMDSTLRLRPRGNSIVMKVFGNIAANVRISPVSSSNTISNTSKHYFFLFTLCSMWLTTIVGMR